ncbi:hypothetical protein L3Q82_018193, partial [Scortum barcoo]
MSVLVQSSRGSVLDAASLIDQGYRRCFRLQDQQKSRVRCCFKRRCFQGVKSHCGAAVDGGGTDGVKTDKPAKKRKRKHSELNQGEVDSQAFHEKIRSVILEGTKALVDSARSLGYLNEATDVVKEPLPSQECSLAALCEMAKELPLVDEEEQQQQQEEEEEEEEEGSAARRQGRLHIACRLVLAGDREQGGLCCGDGRRFDLIVMDPPWENKSVKRSRRYSSLPSTQLKRLPVPLLASPNCLVVTWVTNRPSHLRFVRDELYPHWGVEVVAEWFWIKVTTSGQFVFPLDSHHKKPYEVLVLGRYRSSADDSTSSPESSEVPVEDQRLIVSVPSALHSQKPSLSEVLKPYIRAEAKCLELFARSLQPGWTSWGNELETTKTII